VPRSNRPVWFMTWPNSDSFTAAPVSLTYQLKGVTGSTYTDVTNRLSGAALPPNGRQPINPNLRLGGVLADRAEVVRTENGRDIVKLVPCYRRTCWNANRFNRAGVDDYEWRNVRGVHLYRGTMFEKRLRCNRPTRRSWGRLQRREVYAGGVG
jgi:hypothetical protein